MRKVVYLINSLKKGGPVNMLYTLIKYLDNTEFEVTVTVVDNGNGQLVATVNYPKGGIEFSNKYTKKNVINTTTNKNNTPKTGDNGYGYILGIVLLAVGALLINNKRKKVEN